MCQSPPLCIPLWGSSAHWGQTYAHNYYISILCLFFMVVCAVFRKRLISLSVSEGNVTNHSPPLSVGRICVALFKSNIPNTDHIFCNKPSNDSYFYSIISSSWQCHYLLDGHGLSLDQIWWPDDDTYPNLQFSLGTSGLVEKTGRKKQTVLFFAHFYRLFKMFRNYFISYIWLLWWFWHPLRSSLWSWSGYWHLRGAPHSGQSTPGPPGCLWPSGMVASPDGES